LGSRAAATRSLRERRLGHASYQSRARCPSAPAQRLSSRPAPDEGGNQHAIRLSAGPASVITART
jgi:hypothetical protein